MLTISPDALEQFTKDATATYPDECCGFLLGNEYGEARSISDVIVVVNAKEGDKRRRFVISPKDYLHAERVADEKGLQLIGIYHSHPDHPAVPSEHDRVAAQPFFSYIIVSVQQGNAAAVRSWRLNEAQQFEEEQILSTT